MYNHRPIVKLLRVTLEISQASGPSNTLKIMSDGEQKAFSGEGVLHVVELGESCQTTVDCKI